MDTKVSRKFAPFDNYSRKIVVINFYQRNIFRIS